MSPFSWRLLLLSLASFGLLVAAIGALVRLLQGPILRAAAGWKASDRAALLFGVRMAPAGLAALVVIAFCIPSYLLFEPDAPEERAGWLANVLAGCALALIGPPLFRGIHAMYKSAAFVRGCARIAVPWNGVWLVHLDAPVLACVGVLQPRIVISRAVAECLSAGELAAAIRHEQAHLKSGDNWKRLLLTCAPAPGCGAVEEAWSRAVERAADDASAEQSANHRLDLAQALVRVAKLQTARTPRLATAFAADASDLASRVDRLLRDPETASRAGLRPWLLAGGALATAAIWAPVLPLVHRALEFLVR